MSLQKSLRKSISCENVWLICSLLICCGRVLDWSRKKKHTYYKWQLFTWWNWFLGSWHIFACDLAASVMCKNMPVDSGKVLSISLSASLANRTWSVIAAVRSCHWDIDKWSIPSEGDPCQRLSLHDFALRRTVPDSLPRHFKWSSLDLAVRGFVLTDRNGRNSPYHWLSDAFFQRVKQS